MKKRGGDPETMKRVMQVLRRAPGEWIEQRELCAITGIARFDLYPVLMRLGGKVEKREITVNGKSIAFIRSADHIIFADSIMRAMIRAAQRPSHLVMLMPRWLRVHGV
jgi:hypothetical protein